jgi:cytidylate kinase
LGALLYGWFASRKAKQRGLTLAEYNQLGETDPETDKEVDQYQRELGEKKDNFIIEVEPLGILSLILLKYI